MQKRSNTLSSYRHSTSAPWFSKRSPVRRQTKRCRNFQCIRREPKNRKDWLDAISNIKEWRRHTVVRDTKGESRKIQTKFKKEGTIEFSLKHSCLPSWAPPAKNFQCSTVTWPILQIVVECAMGWSCMTSALKSCIRLIINLGQCSRIWILRDRWAESICVIDISHEKHNSKSGTVATVILVKMRVVTLRFAFLKMIWNQKIMLFWAP